MPTLSFLKVNLFFRLHIFLPSLVHMAFWTIKHEASQSFTFCLPLKTSETFFCTPFFNLPFIIPVAFLQYHVQYHGISVLVLQRCCTLLPVSSSFLAPNFPRLLPFAGIFQQEGEETCFQQERGPELIGMLHCFWRTNTQRGRTRWKNDQVLAIMLQIN